MEQNGPQFDFISFTHVRRLVFRHIEMEKKNIRTNERMFELFLFVYSIDTP